MGRECCCTELAPKLRAATAESARWRKVVEGLVGRAEKYISLHADMMPEQSVARSDLKLEIAAARAELEKG